MTFIIKYNRIYMHNLQIIMMFDSKLYASKMQFIYYSFKYIYNIIKYYYYFILY